MVEIEHKNLKSMNLEDVEGSYKAVTLVHFDSNVRKVYCTDKETFFEEGEQICSCTDPEGYITMVNSAFISLSGYSKKELIGMPHSILRHPDMPAVAFKGMWESLASDGIWYGYVKNLRKDGGFYWVYAKVFSNFRNGQLVGYTSSRLAAPRDKVSVYSATYAEWLLSEQKAIVA